MKLYSVYNFYSFTDPSVIPVTKYFCMNGYMIRIGMVATTILDELNVRCDIRLIICSVDICEVFDILMTQTSHLNKCLCTLKIQ